MGDFGEAVTSWNRTVFLLAAADTAGMGEVAHVRAGVTGEQEAARIKRLLKLTDIMAVNVKCQCTKRVCESINNFRE